MKTQGINCIVVATIGNFGLARNKESNFEVTIAVAMGENNNLEILIQVLSLGVEP